MDAWVELLQRDFATAEELVAWAGEHGWGRPGLHGGERALSLAAAVAAACRDLAEALAEGRRPARELVGLDGVISSVTGRMRVGPAGVAFEADIPPLAQIPLRVGLEAARFALDPDRPRLARCQRSDPPCGRFFVDRSRDGRGRWCSAACGGLERVRRLRQAQG